MESLSAKIVPLSVVNGDGIIAILNAEQASQYGITQHDKISLIRKGEEYVVDVALSSEICGTMNYWCDGRTARKLSYYAMR